MDEQALLHRLLKASDQEIASNAKRQSAELTRVEKRRTEVDHDFLLLVFAGCFATESILWRSILITAGIIIFSCGIWVSLYLERESGYYKCEKCGHIYVPDAASHSFAMHLGKTRFMKYPKCGQKVGRERF